LLIAAALKPGSDASFQAFKSNSNCGGAPGASSTERRS
jgi:hypothetical protein